MARLALRSRPNRRWNMRLVSWGPFVELALLHRRASWFTGFAARRKLGGQPIDGVVVARAEIQDRRFCSRPPAPFRCSCAAAALSGCNTSKMFAGLKPGETLTQGYVIDQQAIDLVPVGSSREQVLLALGTPVDDGDLRQRGLLLHLADAQAAGRLHERRSWSTRASWPSISARTAASPTSPITA